MLPNQTMRGANGKENFLFPLTHLYLTQAIGGDFSHKGTYAMDCVEWSNSGQILKAPYYAPFTCTKIWELVDSGGSVWQSNDVVNTPSGTQIMRILFYHDDSPPPMGSVRSQGQLIGHTGTRGYVTGDHVHIETGVGALSGYQLVQNSYGVWMLKGSTYPYNCLYVNNTVMSNPMGYPWKTATTTPPPPTISSLTFVKKLMQSYYFNGVGTANGSANLNAYRFSLYKGSVIIDDTNYKAYSGKSINVTQAFNLSLLSHGTYQVRFYIRDTFNQVTSKSLNFEKTKTDDIIPLYMMNIIQGGFNGSGYNVL